MDKNPEIIEQIINDLNDAQRQAVCAPAAQHQLVLAGAGSGKTRVLIHRIAWLSQVEDVSLYKQLAVTFTNKAAAEMRQRLSSLLNLSLSGLWVGTFHGLAHRLLRIHWHEAQLTQHFQIIDSDDQLRLIRRIVKDLQIDDKAYPPKQMQGEINRYKERCIRPQHIPAPQNTYEQICLEIYQRYHNHCQRSSLVDFAEILLRAYELLEAHPPLLTHYRQRFSHILVDEFQDTNQLQYAWIQLLLGEQGRLFVVGDDDQSIYGWRGAQADNLQKLQTDLKGIELIRLEQNYRSTGMILDAANALIKHNDKRLGKQLWTAGDKGQAIQIYHGVNAEDEARFIVERIQSWTEKQAGRDYQQCAVLYRTNALSRLLEEKLLQKQIPYRVYGGLRFFERMEIKDTLAYLRLLLNKDDDSAFERVVNHPPRGIGGRSIEQLRAIARGQGLSLWQAAEQAIKTEAFAKRSLSAIGKFLSLIQNLAGENEELSALTHKVIHQSGLWQHFKQKKQETEQMRLDNLEELILATESYETDPDTPMSDLQAFLSDTVLDAGEGQSSSDNAVQLMTLHNAKGLEFPLVFLCGMEEELFPHRMALQAPQGLEEERRLCYVGITRAMQQLYISHVESRRLHGNQLYPRPSRFLLEIPQELLEEVRLQTPVNLYQQYGNYQAKVAKDTPNNLENWIGQRVQHPRFGEGMVTDQEGAGKAARIQVMFYQNGAKWLVLEYAQLEKLP